MRNRIFESDYQQNESTGTVYGVRQLLEARVMECPVIRGYRMFGFMRNTTPATTNYRMMALTLAAGPPITTVQTMGRLLGNVTQEGGNYPGRIDGLYYEDETNIVTEGSLNARFDIATPWVETLLVVPQLELAWYESHADDVDYGWGLILDYEWTHVTAPQLAAIKMHYGLDPVSNL